jgi:hypothetical protein
MHRLALVVVSLITAAACQGNNPASCQLPENMDTEACRRGGPCQTSNDCTSTPDKPVCDTSAGSGACVKCTTDDHALCTGATPRCENNACVACADDGDCGVNGVCLLDGTCADPNRILYTRATGGIDAGACGDVGAECSFTGALALVSGAKNIIKLDDALYAADGGFVTNIDEQVPLTIAARGATLDRGDSGPVLTIIDRRNVTLLGGTITGGTGSNGDGISCNPNALLTVFGTTFTNNEESAIDADQCALRIGKASISNNSARTGANAAAIDSSEGSLTMWLSKIESNKGGGVNVTNNGAIAIIGNLFYNNGSSSSSVSGLLITTTNAPSNRLEFNTIVNNLSSSGLSKGIQCNTVDFVARNNIIWDEASSPQMMITGACKHSYSAIDQDVPMDNDGGNNIDDDPMFQPGFLVGAGSPVQGKADPNADLSGITSVDLAGRERTPPADIGAYQVPVP